MENPQLNFNIEVSSTTRWKWVDENIST